jgi:hypothetical protein
LFALYLLGAAFCFRFGPRDQPSLCCALGLPLGLALAAATITCAMLLGIPCRPWTIAGLLGILLAVTLAGARVPREARRTVAAWSGALLAVLVAVCSVNVSILTYESHRIIYAAKLAARGALTDAAWSTLDWAPFHTALESLAGLAGVDYLYALPPALGCAFLPLFALLVWRGMRVDGAATRRGAAAVTLVSLALATCYPFALQLAVVRVDLATAVYVTAFAGLAFLAEASQDARYAPILAVCIGALAIQDSTSPVAAAMLLLVWLSSSRLPRVEIAPGVHGLLFAVVALACVLLERGPLAGRGELLLAAFAPVCAYWLWADSGWLRPIKRWIPRALALSAATALGSLLVLRPAGWQHALQAFDGLRSAAWGDTWVMVGAFAVLTMFARPRPELAVTSHGLSLYVALIPAAAWFGDGERVALAESGARMLAHILPVTWLYLALALVPAWAAPVPPPPRRAPPPSEPAAVGPYELVGGRARALGLLFVAITAIVLAVSMAGRASRHHADAALPAPRAEGRSP